MDKKELLAKKKMLLKELEKEKQKKKNAEKNLSLYEYKEKEQKPKTTMAKKKSKVAKIPENQKHTIVPVGEFEGSYNYDRRRKEWHQKAGHNDQQVVCSKCKDDDNWETILLDNNKHICYYCWIKKPKTATKTKAKKAKSTSKVVSANAKPITTKEPVVVKAQQTSSKVKVVPVKDYENYNPNDRIEIWHFNSNINEKPVKCDICSSNDNWETIRLSNNKNVCFTCWMKKPANLADSKNNATVLSDAITNKTKYDKEMANELAQETSNKDTNEAKAPGKLFWVISITLGLLLIGLIVVLSLGIISDWTFKF